jgi:hypothetical protein
MATATKITLLASFIMFLRQKVKDQFQTATAKFGRHNLK